MGSTAVLQDLLWTDLPTRGAPLLPTVTRTVEVKESQRNTSAPLESKPSRAPTLMPGTDRSY